MRRPGYFIQTGEGCANANREIPTRLLRKADAAAGSSLQLIYILALICLITFSRTALISIPNSEFSRSSDHLWPLCLLSSQPEKLDLMSLHVGRQTCIVYRVCFSQAEHFNEMPVTCFGLNNTGLKSDCTFLNP